jgi:uncharacterized protein YbbK (DUF523 family)/uncharacterized protein YbgA (DUF1722 family)
MTVRPRLGVSRCLLGEAVRYDGGHKRDAFLVTELGPHVDWVPVCPEVEAGMGTPREPVRLVSRDEDGVPRMLGVTSGHDWTPTMHRWARGAVRRLADEDLSGYVLKKDSPSCGLTRVRVYPPAVEAGRKAQAARTGRGVFAEALLAALPLLPVEDEGRLHDPRLRAAFVERVFAYQRLRALFGGRWTRGALVRFHTIHKLQLLAHSRQRYTDLGRLVAAAKALPRAELAGRYAEGFMAGLARLSTPGRHADVMLHMSGHLRGAIDRASRDELLAAIEDHRQGLVPRAVPVTLLRHHVRHLGIASLGDQTYFNPCPRAFW